MNKLDQLEKLANEVDAEAYPISFNFKLGDFHRAANPETIKVMIQLIRQQNVALGTLHSAAWNNGAETGSMLEEALAAYEAFERGG